MSISAHGHFQALVRFMHIHWKWSYIVNHAIFLQNFRYLQILTNGLYKCHSTTNNRLASTWSFTCLLKSAWTLSLDTKFFRKLSLASNTMKAKKDLSYTCQIRQNAKHQIISRVFAIFQVYLLITYFIVTFQSFHFPANDLCKFDIDKSSEYLRSLVPDYEENSTRQKGAYHLKEMSKNQHYDCLIKFINQFQICTFLRLCVLQDMVLWYVWYSSVAFYQRKGWYLYYLFYTYV